MKESYCIKDKRVTPCVEPSGYQKDKRGTQDEKSSIRKLKHGGNT